MKILPCNFWPLLIFIVAAGPRLIDLGARPFWLDEAFTVQRASLPISALITDSFQNHHMPSFFLLLSPFVSLGHPQFWLRFPSAVCGAACVMLVYLIAARIAGRYAGLIAALILGFSPTAIAFSQEARSYTLEMMLILVALYGIVRLSLDVPAASERLDKSSQWPGWICFIFGSAAAIDVLGDGLPWLLAANLSFALMLTQTKTPRTLLSNVLIADGVIALCSVPFYLLMLRQQGSGFVDSVMWIPNLNWARLWYDFGSVYFMRVADSVTFQFMAVQEPGLLLWLIDVAMAAGAIYAGWRLRRRPAVLAVLGISFIFLPVLFTMISIWRPILLPRYILWSAAPFAILCGIGVGLLVTRFPLHLRPMVIAFAAALLVINALPYYKAETKPRWDIAAKLLASEVRPGDVVYLYDTGALPILRLYLPKGSDMVVLNDSDGDLQHAIASISEGKRVWAVFGHAGQTADVKQRAVFVAKTQVLGAPRLVQTAGKRIQITLFTPAGMGPLAAVD